MLLFIIIYFVNYLNRGLSTVDFNNSDEDEELNDALILINLLKSVYSKAHRDGLESSNGNTIPSLDMSTCATTTEASPNSNLMSPWSSKNYTKLTEISVTTTTVSFPGITHGEEYMQNYRFPEKYRRNYRIYPEEYRRDYGFPFRRQFRRKMAPIGYNYYYDSNKNRRFDYEDAFEEHQSDKGSIKDTTTGLSTKTYKKNVSPTSVPKTISDNVKSSIIITKEVQNNKPFNFVKETRVNNEYRKGQKLKFQKDEHKTRKFEALKTISVSTSRNPLSIHTVRDPIVFQVESELLKELKSEGFTVKSDLTTNKKFSISFKNSYNKRRPLRRTRGFRPSLKIYLSKSSKIPIPFPENNAFCYTNPENSLCRTLI